MSNYQTMALNNITKSIVHIKKTFGDIVDPTEGREVTETRTTIKAIVSELYGESNKSISSTFLAYINSSAIQNIKIEDGIEYNGITYEVKKVQIGATGNTGSVYFG